MAMDWLYPMLDRHFWVGYLVREGAVDANDFQPGPQLETSGARAFTSVDFILWSWNGIIESQPFNYYRGVD